MTLLLDGPPVRPACFQVDADPEPGLLARLLAPLARRGLEPDSVHMQRRGGRVHVAVAFEAIAVEAIHLIEGNLRQVIGVVRVTVEIAAARGLRRAA